MSQRRTITSPATLRGTTLFTAATTTLTIRPADPTLGAGIFFRRTDLPTTPTIPALISHIVPDARHTVLHPGPPHPPHPPAAAIHTTEHILSALAGLGITDAVLDLDGPEVPIVDGSAGPFVEAILAAGLTTLPGDAAPPIVIREAFTIREGDASIELLPPNPAAKPGLEIEYHLDYGPGAPIPPQSVTFALGDDGNGYAAAIAPARTFCLLQEAQAMRAMGLFKHLEPKDMLVIGPDGHPIDNALRFPDEPARHKLLDVIGDLALVGRPIHGHIIARRSGHAMNHAAAGRLMKLA